MVWSHGVISCQ